MSNRLVNETSPYLLQHADNPVDWYPWGETALEKARREDKPIFLSIGYSACHWCHVMAHESFEDDQVAAILNEHFVSIKVDREERPDLDQIYMSAVQAMTGGGGWPMSIFLTPDGEPFYGGTYFPPTPRYGMPSFSQVLIALADAWQERREELVKGGRQMARALAEQAKVAPASASVALQADTLQAAFRDLGLQFDARYGGFGQAPKFPQPMVLEFLLRYHAVTGSEQALHMVTHTLDKMARRGMYDQIGGGFHRYSVDDRWLVPHFEKMLYDQSQLARVYLHAWQVTGNEFFRSIVEEILDYVVREMLDPAGGFYSTQDADSEGEEGKFFVWTPDEIREVLGDDADEFIAAYSVTRHGNFEGKNILEFVGDMEQRPALAEARRKLFEAREQRVHPGRDEKILTSWNGLMLAAFAEAARALDRDDYRTIAERNADFLLPELRQGNGRLLRTWKRHPERVLKGPSEGAGEAKLNGYLEDYSYLIEGLLELYQTTFEPRWFVAAQELAETMLERFADSEGTLYDTSDDHETLITRPRDLQDNATPSGNAMAATTLLKLAGFTNELRYADIAHQALAQVQSMMAQYPLGFGQWLQALAYALSKPREIAIVGDPDTAGTQALLNVVRDGYRPFQVVALGASGAQASAVPLLQDRGQVDGKAAAYVCRDFTCQAPVTTPPALEGLLGGN
ncbi:MAG: thioredoxin domain-containing protein [Anaerolineae bacterium]|nr:thioredoxin domain-containing protein [Anaerolineae bacterium]